MWGNRDDEVEVPLWKESANPLRREKSMNQRMPPESATGLKFSFFDMDVQNCVVTYRTKQSYGEHA